MERHKLIIKNFGPIKELELEDSNMLILIGPQASGKSTIGKLIYFFKSLPTDLFYYWEPVRTKNTSEEGMIKMIRNKFIGIWGADPYLKDFELEYHYQKDVWIKINFTKGKKHINPVVSDKIDGSIPYYVDLRVVYDKLCDMLQLFNMSELLGFSAKFQANYMLENSNIAFIPAGRSLLYTLTEQLEPLSTNNLDALRQEFMSDIASIRRRFRKSTKDIILNQKNKLNESYMMYKGNSMTKNISENIEIHKERVVLAEVLVSKILKGEYRHEKNADRLYFTEKESIHLKYASAGQQEAIWIVYSLLREILYYWTYDVITFLVVEEAEAHLYPEAQKEMINLMALFYNTNPENQLIITTHSPYILASLNNLLYANKVGREKPEAISKIISQRLWVDVKDVQAFFIRDGKLEDIIDHDLEMIKNEALDSASRIINEEFDQIYAQED